MSGLGDWQRELADAVRDVRTLLGLLHLTEEQLPAVPAPPDYPLFAPRGFVGRMQRGDPADPLLRQVLPDTRELLAVEGYSSDPLLESRCSPIPGALRKYEGRILLAPTNACAVHCRFCFRRGQRGAPHHGSFSLDEALSLIRADGSLTEVILSGGDPLVLDDKRIASVFLGLEEIAHVSRLRIHTRVPVVLPTRVTDGLLAVLGSTRLRVVISIHANHPAELDEQVATGLEKLSSTGALMLCQSVLLAGVNDSADVLVALSERLAATGVLPYYLHLLDKVAGAAHFDVSENHSRELLKSMRQRLPGYLVPRLVREVPEAAHKIPVV